MDTFHADRAKLRRATVFSKEVWEAAVKMGRSETLLLSQIGGRCPVLGFFAGRCIPPRPVETRRSWNPGSLWAKCCYWVLRCRHPCLHVFENGDAVQPRMAAPQFSDRLLGCGGPLFGSSGLDCALKDYSKLNGLQRLWQEIIGAKLNGFRVKMDIIRTQRQRSLWHPATAAAFPEAGTGRPWTPPG